LIVLNEEHGLLHRRWIEGLLGIGLIQHAQAAKLATWVVEPDFVGGVRVDAFLSSR
jgi:hypothetical protein